MDCDFALIIRLIDDALTELGSGEIADARKASNQLLDLRLVCMTMKEEAETNVRVP